MRIDLSGQSILVTGASRGIGAATARQLAASGARVAVHCGRRLETAEALATEIGEGARAFSADLSSADQCTDLWNAVVRSFGRIDAVVNNAGVAVSSPLEAETERWLDDWERTMAVNLTAAGLLCRFAIAHFQHHGGGRIVNIASRAAFRGDQPSYLAYAASKGGMVALTRSIARGFGKAGIKAFVVAPGFTRTEMAQDFIDEFGEDYAVNDIALDRLTEPQDIAPTVAFLLSGLADHANRRQHRPERRLLRSLSRAQSRRSAIGGHEHRDRGSNVGGLRLVRRHHSDVPHHFLVKARFAEVQKLGRRPFRFIDLKAPRPHLRLDPSRHQSDAAFGTVFEKCLSELRKSSAFSDDQAVNVLRLVAQGETQEPVTDVGQGARNRV
jgi:3-oxoacyl-[acyl-carrier protein] reductase